MFVLQNIPETTYALDDSSLYVSHRKPAATKIPLPAAAGGLFNSLGAIPFTIQTKDPANLRTVLLYTFYTMTPVFRSVEHRRGGLLLALKCLKYLYKHRYLKVVAFTKLVARWLRTIDYSEHGSYLEAMINYCSDIPLLVIPRELILRMGSFCYRDGSICTSDMKLLDSFFVRVDFYLQKWKKPDAPIVPGTTTTTKVCSSSNSISCGCGQPLTDCQTNESSSSTCTSLPLPK
jgi:hypothetical protein